MITIIHFILFWVGFLLIFKFIKDSNFDKIFKQGKTRTILVASIVVSLIGGYLLSTSIITMLELILQIIQ